MTTKAASALHPSTVEFLRECRQPSTIADAIERTDVIRRKLDAVSANETNPIVRAHLEEGYQTLAAIQRMSELVVQGEQQLGAWSNRLESATGHRQLPRPVGFDFIEDPSLSDS